MNKTLVHFSLTKIKGSRIPYFCDHVNQFELYRSRFSYFSIPFIFKKKILTFYRSSFSHFLDQIIVDNKQIQYIHPDQQTKLTLSCLIFDNIQTATQGSIFSLSNYIKIDISQCFFNNITSQSYPGCFEIKESNAKVTKCTFTDCKGSGNNEPYYGNTFYCYNCSSINSEISCSRCSNRVDITADSTVVFQISNSLEISSCNMSDNCGNQGSASFSIRGAYIELIQQTGTLLRQDL